MAVSEIPLSPDNQKFTVTLAGTAYVMRLIWRDPVWCLDILNTDGTTVVAPSLPLVTGLDLLAPYEYLDLGFGLVVGCDTAGQDYPTKTDLGLASHLYVITES